MFKLSKKTILITIIVISIIIIIFFMWMLKRDDEHDEIPSDNIMSKIKQLTFADELPFPSRKRLNRRHSRSKIIFVSPKREIETVSIDSMSNMLRKKLDKTTISNKMNDRYNIKKPKYIVKLFYADWCPHCRRFNPIWNTIKHKFENINFKEVDCTKYNHNLPYVSGYPTIAIFDSNEKHIGNYEQQRTQEKIEEFFNKLN